MEPEALPSQPQPTIESPVITPAANTSGQGKMASIPPEIRRWNWGAFFFNWIWGVGNQTYIALLGLIPFINIVFAFVLGAKGNEWAWRARKWDSVEQFKRVQRKWAFAALWFLIGIIVFVALVIFAAWKLTSPNVEAADSFFSTLAAHDYETAYGMTSSDFQNNATLDDFESFLTDNPILTEVSDESFPNRTIENASATLIGTITGTDGSSSDVTVNEVKEGDAWKISDVTLPDASGTAAATPIDNTQSVVNVICDDGSGGSGSIYTSGGVVLTNNHVINKAKSCLVAIPDPATGAAEEIYESTPVIVPILSKKYDIAMLQIDGPYTDASGTTWGKYPATFPEFVSPDACNGDPLKLGESLKIYGYPVSSGGYNLTVTQGIISSFADDGSVLTDAEIDSGNSGGIAVDKDGCFVGIPSAVQLGNYQNLGVIIPWNIIQEFLDSANGTTTGQ